MGCSSHHVAAVGFGISKIQLSSRYCCAVTGPVSSSWWPVWGSRSGGAADCEQAIFSTDSSLEFEILKWLLAFERWGLSGWTGDGSWSGGCRLSSLSSLVLVRRVRVRRRACAALPSCVVRRLACGLGTPAVGRLGLEKPVAVAESACHQPPATTDLGPQTTAPPPPPPPPPIDRHRAPSTEHRVQEGPRPLNGRGAIRHWAMP
jgi:hypothetical protein